MKKAKVYNWHDTNLALFGSDLEKKIKAAAAQDEPAWKKAGQKVGLKIWRIEKFHVVKWPERKKGNFHVGDSYIVLNTYKKNKKDALGWDIHFWIGSNSTADEYGTAAYKTVELDHFLQDKAHQHRETQGHESKLFRSYFQGHHRLRYLSGGIETGFNHVEEKKIKPRLYRVKGLRGHISLTEVSLSYLSLNDGDVFILDTQDDIFQWNGFQANVYEKRQAGEFARDLRKYRNSKPKIHIIDQEKCGFINEAPEFWKYMKLGKNSKIKSSQRGGQDAKVHEFVPQLWKLSQRKDKLILTKITEQQTIEKLRLDTNDVFILDTGFHVHVWVGKHATMKEKRSGMRYAEHYLAQNKRPPMIPITRISEGMKRDDFDTYFNDDPLPSDCKCLIS